MNFNDRTRSRLAITRSNSFFVSSGLYSLRFSASHPLSRPSLLIFTPTSGANLLSLSLDTTSDQALVFLRSSSCARLRKLVRWDYGLRLTFVLRPFFQRDQSSPGVNMDDYQHAIDDRDRVIQVSFDREAEEIGEFDLTDTGCRLAIGRDDQWNDNTAAYTLHPDASFIGFRHSIHRRSENHFCPRDIRIARALFQHSRNLIVDLNKQLQTHLETVDVRSALFTRVSIRSFQQLRAECVELRRSEKHLRNQVDSLTHLISTPTRNQGVC